MPDCADGREPAGDLIIDAKGNLFGTTESGANGGGTVFEIVKTAHGYSSTPTILASVNPVAQGGVIADAERQPFRHYVFWRGE
jgi:hypothetical protein